MNLTQQKHFASAVEHMSTGVCITDPREPDNPIVYVNPGFTRLTGYSPEEAIGRNSRFLQSKSTDPEAIGKLRQALDRVEPVTVVLLNKRKNGSLFWNELKINPVLDEEGELIHYIGLQTDVTARVEARKDMALAAKVQKALLPPPLEGDLFRIESLYRPYTFISGDCYDYRWDGNRQVLSGYLFDIMGHGVATALQSSALRVLFEQVAKKEMSLAQKMAWVNDACLPYLADEFFIAAICFEMDFRRKILSYSAGGVNYFLASTATHRGLVSVPGLFLGMFKGTEFEQHELPFDHGDAFYFFSDGLYEMFPFPPGAFPAGFEQTVDWFHKLSTGPDRRDDLSALCIQVK